MRSRVFFLSLLLLAAMSAATAQTRADIFSAGTPLTWLGLDFSAAKFIGDRERWGSQSDMRQLMELWNELMVKEASKYNVAKATGRTKVENSTDITTEHNAELDISGIYSDSQKDFMRLKRSDIEEIVAAYDFKDLGGLGLMFVVESFSKLDNQGSVYVTFVNMETKEVLLTERLTGGPSGFGMRNYWGGAIYQIIEKMRKKEFEMWRKKSL